MQSIKLVMAKGFWLASVDLKDAYFHVPIFPGHHQFLRFSWQGQAYQFQALPFGLTTAPFVFTKVLAPVIAHLHRLRVFIFVYLDDILIVGQSAQEVYQSVQLCLTHLTQAGYILNLKKSDLIPTQDLVYIGGRFRSDLGKVFLPIPRRTVLISTVQSFLQIGG